MKYCSTCGIEVSLKIPEGEDRLRHVCEACGTIHYQNPKIITGVVAEWNRQVLLCKRAIEPRYGFWTLPAGFMENGETTEQAAAREAYEEATATLANMRLFALENVPHISQVHVIYQADLVAGQCAAGIESLEVKLFDEQDIPWDELAFRTVRKTLECFFQDRREGVQQVHHLTLS